MEKISYEKPRMERWQVKARCGMLAGSVITPPVQASFKLDAAENDMSFTVGVEHKDGDTYGSFQTSWLEEQQ